MKRLFLGVALLGAAASPLQAQVTLQRAPNNFIAGPIVTCMNLADSSTNRCVLPATTLYDLSGNALGTSGNPLYVSGGGGGGGGAVTIANGADVVEGTNTDASGASSVFGMAKGIYGYEANRAATSQLINGTVTVGSITNPVVLGAGTATIGSVTNTGTFVVQNTAATPAGTNNVGSITGNVGYVDYASSSLAASASSTAQVRTPPVWAVRYGCTGRSAQAGTLSIITTVAGSVSNAYPIASQPMTAGQSLDLSASIRGSGNYYCQITNGTTASTDAWVIVSFTAAN